MNVLLVKPFMYPQAVQIGCELEDLQKAVVAILRQLIRSMSRLHW